MQYPVFPLKDIYVTQPFGVNWVGPGAYDHNPSGLHGGVDLRAPIGTPVYAPCDGKIVQQAKAVGAAGNILVLERLDDVRNEKGYILGERLLFAHLSKFKNKKSGIDVKAGDLICYTGNSGMKSTGPQLHYGNKEIYYLNIGGPGPWKQDPDSQYRGYVDPMQYHGPDILKLPVDLGYGIAPVSRKEFAPTFLWILRQPGLWTKIGIRGYRALRWGRWDLRAILDPAMFVTWSRMTKMEYNSRK